jgi:hypothetical protein
MAGYGIKEARIDRQRKPNGNVCGSCGEESVALLCSACRGILAPGRNDFPQEDDANEVDDAK